MSLDKAEKQRTYDTEKVRLKARKDFEDSRSAAGWVLFLLLIGVLVGGLWFGFREGGPFSGAGGAMKQIDALAAGPAAGGPTADEQIVAILRAEKRPGTLAVIVRTCDAKARQRDTTRAASDLYWQVRQEAIARLGELAEDKRTPEALVKLLCDRDLFWNDATYRALAAAITRCGRPCLAMLEAIEDDHPRKRDAENLAITIRRGLTIRP